jgi:hypothetical protein
MVAIVLPQSSSRAMYPRESDLVRRFVGALQSEALPWGPVEIACEWDYRTGITDVLARSPAGELLAFEAKLSDWRRALHQAYRNTVFATRAYVVLPASVAERAAKSCELFLRYQVGLCSVDETSVRVLIEAPQNEVLVPWLHRKAIDFFEKEFRERSVRKNAEVSGRNLPQNRCVA